MKKLPLLKRQAGFSLVAVIFLVTVLATGVVFIQRISNVSVATNNLAMQGARAWQAAQAGAEWGVYQVTTGGCPAASTSFNLTEQSLTGFEVTVTCNSTIYTEQGLSVTMYFLEVFASSGVLGSTPDYVSRKISLVVEG
ncbi:MAG: pilus assembly protein MshP [Gammaproteobacteria bacterium]|nr:MAG: pilus assembly protein MshP [Gammaproteobacteria bacterium]